VEAPSIFLPGAELIYKAGYTAGHCHGYMNNDNFEKLVAGKFIQTSHLILGNN
jgi:hypothetical protein